jgi:hypothetical protein
MTLGVKYIKPIELDKEVNALLKREMKDPSELPQLKKDLENRTGAYIKRIEAINKEIEKYNKDVEKYNKGVKTGIDALTELKTREAYLKGIIEKSAEEYQDDIKSILGKYFKDDKRVAGLIFGAGLGLVLAPLLGPFGPLGAIQNAMAYAQLGMIFDRQDVELAYKKLKKLKYIK